MPAISKWESGRTNLDISMLPIIPRYFNVTIDFLLGFYNEMNVEDIKGIYDDMMNKFLDLRFEDAEKEWSNYLRQYPNNYLLVYELVTIGVFNMEKIKSIEKMHLFAQNLINTFEKCTYSDDLKIKQGLYFQMVNLYIMLMLEDYDKAQIVLNEIPEQSVNPNFLLSIIHINKGEFEKANKNI